MRLTFEWDEEKAKANLSKHKVGFEEARTVFGDPLSVTIADPAHSEDENRYVDVGMSSRGRLLVVVYTQRGSSVRIISSRKAVRLERLAYEEHGM